MDHRIEKSEDRPEMELNGMVLKGLDIQSKKQILSS